MIGLFIQLSFASDLDSGIEIGSSIKASSNELKKTTNMIYIKNKIKAKINGGGNQNDLILDGTNIGGINMLNSKAKNIYMNTEIKGNTLTTGGTQKDEK